MLSPMPRMFRLALLAALLPAACAVVPDLAPVPAYSPAALGAVRYKAVLVAGDGSLPVFDNAVDAMAERLRRGGRTTGITRLSAVPAVIAQEGVRSASLDRILDAVGDMRPGPGEGCLVFATSHGAPRAGLALSLTREALSPEALDRALVRGCGNAPTVVVASGCFSGVYAQAPMARPNRVILTAARADRTSFGCGAGFTYTVYDKCLLDSLDGAATWRDVSGAVGACVSAEERRQRVTPSRPQASFGDAVAGLPAPGRAAP